MFEFSAGAVIYYWGQHEGKKALEFLLLKYATHWGFPKGNIEKGETSQMAAIREVKEETNLDVHLDSGFKNRIMYYYKNTKGELVHKYVTFFTARAPNKKVTISWEHEGFRWLSYKDARQLLAQKNSRELLEKARYFILKSVRMENGQ